MMNKPKLFLFTGILLCSLALALSAAQPVAAATYTVNNTGDGSDANPGDGVCETVAGNGICTLRAAIEEANAASGPDTILFESGVNIVMPNSALPVLDDTGGGTTIKGNPTWILGTVAGPDVDGLVLNSNNNKIQGMYITNFGGNGLFVQGDNNIIGTDGDGIDDASEGSISSSNGSNGILIEGSNTGNWLAGNLIGLTFDGTGDAGNGLHGIEIDGTAHDNLIGTNADGVSDELERNVISGNTVMGIEIDTSNNVIAGNYIGTNAAGDAAIPNDYRGIEVQRDGNRIGGTTAAERNVISGNGGSGVQIYAGAANNLIQGNYIGTDANGNGNLGNDGHGISLGGNVTGNIVGGIESGAANRIAHNAEAGIQVYETVSNNWRSYDNSLRGNSIFANGELGIDLLPEIGVTLNDAGDGDDGSNHLQNFPVLSSAMSDSNQIIIAGTLNSSASTTFDLDFFANSSCDLSGYGEGEIYLGTETVTTNSNGDDNFTASFPISVTAGYSLTATATDPDGNTSEFSLCQEVVDLPPQLLTAYIDGSGSGSISSLPVGISCPGDCDELYDYGTQVTLTAIPNTDSIFRGWSGACIGTGSCTVRMMAPMPVTANFDLLPPDQLALTVNLIGDGEGTVTGPGIDCNDGPKTDCTEAFTIGTIITLTASADTGSTFAGWGGACSGTASCSVTMTEVQSITATFALIPSDYKVFLPLLIR